MKQLRSWASGGNTVGGQNALWSRTIGNYDTAVGFFSLKAVTFAEFNTGSAQVTFFSTMHIRILPPESGLLTNTAHSNTDNGAFALFDNTRGASNIAVRNSVGP